MKTVTLKIGAKNIAPVKVPLRKAENIDDLSQLAKGNVEVITRWANRGLAIEHQERSGARDRLRELRGKTGADALTEEQITAEIAKIVSEYDPTLAAAKGGPRERKPITITAPKSGKLTMDDFRKQLEAAGVKINMAVAEE